MSKKIKDPMGVISKLTRENKQLKLENKNLKETIKRLELENKNLSIANTAHLAYDEIHNGVIEELQKKNKQLLRDSTALVERNLKLFSENRKLIKRNQVLEKENETLRQLLADQTEKKQQIESIWYHEEFLTSMEKSRGEEIVFRNCYSEYGQFVDARIFYNNHPTKRGICLDPDTFRKFVSKAQSILNKI